MKLGFIRLISSGCGYVFGTFGSFLALFLDGFYFVMFSYIEVLRGL